MVTRIFPEIAARSLASLLLALCTTLTVAQPTAPQKSHRISATIAPPFNPFTDYHALPPGLVWVVQADHPAEQLESEQARAITHAITRTDLFAESAKAWSRLARTLTKNPADAPSLLGRRVQFIAGPRSQGLPWALTLEIEQEQRRDLITRLKAFRSFRRHQRSVFELEDGRYLLAVFERQDSAYLLIAPRSDRTLKPERDPETVLFFEMFDRLAGHTPPPSREHWHPLAKPIIRAGPGELLLARLESVADELEDEINQVPNRDDSGGDDQSDESESESGGGGYTVLSLNRAAGGWEGRIVKATKEMVDPFPDSPRLPVNQIVNTLPSPSWLVFSTSQGSGFESIITASTQLPALFSSKNAASRLLAIIDPAPENPESVPVLAMVQIINADSGPVEFDAAVNSLLVSLGVGAGVDGQSGGVGGDVGGGHAGLFPSAVRVQKIERLTLLGPSAQIAWGFAPAQQGHRAAVLTLSQTIDPPIAERTLNTLLEATQSLAAPGLNPFFGRLQPAALVHRFKGILPAESTPWDLLSRVESITWQLSPIEIGGRPAIEGPVTLTLVQTRQGELGTK